MQIQAKVTLPPLFTQAPGSVRRIAAQEIGRSITLLAERIATRARDTAPVDRGILRASIFTEVTPGVGPVLVRGLVATGRQAPYAEDVERGTPPHWVKDIDALKGWARRKLGDERRAYAVRRAIAKRGTRPQPYLMPAAREVEAQMPAELQQAGARLVQRLGAL